MCPQRPDGRGPDAFYFRVLGHQHKDFHNRVGRVGKYLIVYRFYIAVANLEAFVDGLNVVFCAGAENCLIVKLKNNVGELCQRQHSAIIGLHHQLDIKPFALILVAQHLRQSALMVKQQPVFVTVCDQLEPVA